MINIKSQVYYEGYSSERYYHSLEQLKSIFILTSNGLQPNIIINESKLITKSIGDIEFGDHIKSLNLKIDCAGEVLDISHSLLKLAWTTRTLLER